MGRPHSGLTSTAQRVNMLDCNYVPVWCVAGLACLPVLVMWQGTCAVVFRGVRLRVEYTTGYAIDVLYPSLGCRDSRSVGSAVAGL